MILFPPNLWLNIQNSSAVAGIGVSSSSAVSKAAAAELLNDREITIRHILQELDDLSGGFGSKSSRLLHPCYGFCTNEEEEVVQRGEDKVIGVRSFALNGDPVGVHPVKHVSSKSHNIDVDLIEHSEI